MTPELTDEQLKIVALEGQVQFLQAQLQLYMREIQRLREQLKEKKSA